MLVSCSASEVMRFSALQSFSDLLNRPPMVGVLLVIQMSDASDMRRVTICLRPIDRFFLGIGSLEHMVRVVFDHIILNGRPLRATFRTSFYVYDCHNLLSFDTLARDSTYTKLKDGPIDPSDNTRFNVVFAIHFLAIGYLSGWLSSKICDEGSTRLVQDAHCPELSERIYIQSYPPKKAAPKGRYYHSPGQRPGLRDEPEKRAESPTYRSRHVSTGSSTGAEKHMSR